MEIPSSQAGVVKEVKVKLGDKVSQGSLVALIEAAAGAQRPRHPLPPRRRPRRRPTASAAPARSRAASPTAALPPHEPSAPQGQLPHASPSVRRFARELGVPLDEVKGSGPKGRITQEDVQGFVKGVMSGAVQTGGAAAQGAGAAPAAAVCPACCRGRRSTSPSSAPIERKDLSRIKKISGANLHRNWVMIPHVTNNDEADITELEALPRAAQQGEREERHQGHDARRS